MLQPSLLKGHTFSVGRRWVPLKLFEALLHQAIGADLLKQEALARKSLKMSSESLQVLQEVGVGLSAYIVQRMVERVGLHVFL